MKKEIIVGVFVVAILLLITPTIPAQQYTLMKDTIKNDFQQHLDVVFTALKTMVEDRTQIENQKGIVIDSFNEMKQIWEHAELELLPTYSKSLINLLLSLILSLLGAILGTIFGIIFGPFLVILVKVLTFPAILFAKIIEYLSKGSQVIAA